MQKTPISKEQIFKIALNVYHYGSFVYETFQDGISDYDYIVIFPDKFQDFNGRQFEKDNCQYSFYTKSAWQERLDRNEIDAIETYFLPKKYIIKETVKFSTNIVKEKIRENFSKTASNSFVKCKKKLTVEKDFAPRVGKKSLWHSLRIINFGTQILKYGRIKDYTSVNHLYDEIVNCESNDWKYYKEKYQQLYNKMKTEFRLAEHKKL